MSKPNNYRVHALGGGLVHNSSEIESTVTVPAGCVVPANCKAVGAAVLPDKWEWWMAVDSGHFKTNYAGRIGTVHYYSCGCETETFDDMWTLFNLRPFPDRWADSNGEFPTEEQKIPAMDAMAIIRRRIEGA